MITKRRIQISGYSRETQLLVSISDFMKSYNSGLQIDHHVPHWTSHKASDTENVPPQESTMEFTEQLYYNNCLNMLLTNMKMKIEVEGEQSKDVTVASGSTSPKL